MDNWSAFREMALSTLKKRHEFLRLRGGLRAPTPVAVVEAKPETRSQKLPGLEARPAPRETSGCTRRMRNRGAELPPSASPIRKPIDSAAVPPGPPAPPRFGFVVTKKIGGAVQRNRIRRRLKAAIASIADDEAVPGYDYVVVARRAALTQSYQDLISHLTAAFRRVRKLAEAKGDLTV